MKISKKSAKPSAEKSKKEAPGSKTRKMEPLKSKELKNQRFDDFDEDDDADTDTDQIDPEIMDEGGFGDFDGDFDDDDDL